MMSWERGEVRVGLGSDNGRSLHLGGVLWF